MSDERLIGRGPRTAGLLRRVTELEEALERGGDRIPWLTAHTVLETLESVRGRLELGVDHTLVALAGGTGSGKSSVFNALSGLQFADVGVRRPTTSQVTACVWAHGATEILDWLGVPHDRRIERESELDGESQADLRGLVLLDMPDHDSVEPEHRAVVDRVLPQVDLLVWVLDPQKYADDVLHREYLSRLIGHEAAMLVLLNQIDTVPVSGQVSVLRDMDRLLREDGLTGVPVYAVSARTGEGLPVVRDVLARAVAGRGVAERHAAAEIDDAVRALGATVAPAEPDVAAAAEEAVDGLVAAAGIPETVAAVGQAVRARGRAPRVGPVQADRVSEVCRRWSDRAGDGLPREWRASVAHTVAAASSVTAAADERLSELTVSVRRPLVATALRLLALVAGVAALVLVGLTAGVLVSDQAWNERSQVLALAAGGAALLAVVLLLLASLARRVAARRRGRAVDASARRVLATVVDDLLVQPTVRVLEDHRAVREAAEPRPILDRPTPGPGADEAPLGWAPQDEPPAREARGDVSQDASPVAVNRDDDDAVVHVTVDVTGDAATGPDDDQRRERMSTGNAGPDRSTA